MAAVDDLDEVLEHEQFHLGQGEFAKGNPKPALRFFSHREDVTLNNPLSPPALPRVGGSRSLRLCGPWRIAFQRWQVP
jgi:hypothetical protein